MSSCLDGYKMPYKKDKYVTQIQNECPTFSDSGVQGHRNLTYESKSNVWHWSPVVLIKLYEKEEEKMLIIP